MNTGLQLHSPLINSCVNSVLLQSAPDFNQLLFEFVNIIDDIVHPWLVVIVIKALSHHVSDIDSGQWACRLNISASVTKQFTLVRA